MSAFRMLAVVALLGTCAQAVEIDPMKHSIMKVTPGNFDTVIGKFRNDAVNAIWFYTDNAKDDKAFLEPYNKIAAETKGMIKIACMDASSGPGKAFAEKYGVTSTPGVVVFPPNPMPHYPWKGAADAAGAKKLHTHLMKLMPSFVSDLTPKAERAESDKVASGIKKFLSDDPAKPKVMLFSEKDKVPTLFKALSAETVLHRTCKFGFINVGDDASDAATQAKKDFKIKALPSVAMQRRGLAGKMEKEVYKGEMTFQGIQAWVNLYSESGMGDTKHGAGGDKEPVEDSKPWRDEAIPEVTGPSHKDICFKGEGLCVIYLKDKGPLSEKETKMLEGLSKQHESQLSGRGTVLKWMWMDMHAEPEFKKLFDPEILPNVVVFNPHKRLRYVKSESEKAVGQNEINALIEKIMGGDARFKIVKGQKLPAFANRNKDEGKGKQEL